MEKLVPVFCENEYTRKSPKVCREGQKWWTEEDLIRNALARSVAREREAIGFYNEGDLWVENNRQFFYPKRNFAKKAEALVKNVVRNKGCLYTAKGYGVRKKLDTSRLGRELLLILQDEDWALLKDFSKHIPHPYLRILDNARNLLVPMTTKIHDPAWFDVDIVVSNANAIAREVVAQATSDEVRKELAAIRRNSNKTLKSAKKYLDNIFDRYSRVLVVRADGYYNVDCRDTVGFVETQSDLKRLIKSFKNHPLFEHLIGYAWKREWGEQRKYHYHFLFLFDGAKVRNDITLGRLIGEFWVKEVTASRGSYFNSNGKLGKYPEVGIGMISHDSEKRVRGLQNVLRYLTKFDYYMRPAFHGCARNFGKGGMKGLKPLRRGRKRKITSDMA